MSPGIATKTQPSIKVLSAMFVSPRTESATALIVQFPLAKSEAFHVKETVMELPFDRMTVCFPASVELA